MAVHPADSSCVPQALGESRGRQVIEQQRHLLRIDGSRDGSDGLALVTGTDDQIEVIGAGLARAEEFEARRQPRAGRPHDAAAQSRSTGRRSGR